MKQLKSICLLLMMALLPMQMLAGEEQKEESLNISEIVNGTLLPTKVSISDSRCLSLSGVHRLVSGISARSTLCPRASSSTLKLTARSTSRWLMAPLNAHWT